MLSNDYFTDVRGAVYIPVRSFNAYQQWRDYSSEITQRDLGYARKLNLNSLRVWLSYEYWLFNKDDFSIKFEDFLTVANQLGFRVMPSLFECCGRDPSEETINDRDQFTGTAVRSPGTEITNDPSRWNEPFEFVKWFMNKYKDDQRLLAIEMTNEPKCTEDEVFAIALAKEAKKYNGNVPITIASQELGDNTMHEDYVDVLQTHENIHLSEYQLDTRFYRIRMIQDIVKKPVWVTEWQRLRKSAVGFDGEQVDKSELRPCHVSIAKLLNKHHLGNFVWSLMLKPAYLTGQRSVGTFNGIFHEDGSVYSLEDAREIANDPNLELVENNTLPEFFDRVAKLSE